MENAVPVPSVLDFIYLVGGTFRDAHTTKFLAIKLPFNYRPVQIHELLDGAGVPADLISKFEYLIAIIQFRTLLYFIFSLLIITCRPILS